MPSRKTPTRGPPAAPKTELVSCRRVPRYGAIKASNREKMPKTTAERKGGGGER